MPAFNERATVEKAIEQTLAIATSLHGGDLQLVVVDDGSTDGTRELLTDRDWPSNVEVLVHERNRGKGAAVRTALDRARGKYVAVMDADLEYDPADILPMLQHLTNGSADAVFGVRGFASHSAFSFWYSMGNQLVTLAVNVLYNVRLADTMTCHKIVRTDLLKALPLRASGFAIEAEIVAGLVLAGARIHEVPVTYDARRREEGKKLTAADGLRVLATLMRCRLGARRTPPAPPG